MGAAGTRQMRTVFRDKDLMKSHLGLDHEEEKEQLKKSLEAGKAKGGTRLSRIGNIIEEFTKSQGGAARRSSVIDYFGQKYHSAILGQSTAQKLREKEEQLGKSSKEKEKENEKKGEEEADDEIQQSTRNYASFCSSYFSYLH